MKTFDFKRQKEQGKVSFFNRHTWAKKLIVVTILTTISLVGFPRTARPQETVTIAKQAEENTVISAEKYTTVEGKMTWLKVEYKDNSLRSYLNGRYDASVDLTSTINKRFGGKFTVKQILIDRPYMMVIGIDANGNYGSISLLEDQTFVYVSKDSAKALEEEGVSVNWEYDEKKDIFVQTFRDKDGKTFAAFAYPVDGSSSFYPLSIGN